MEFDFDKWAQLAQEDPAEFERQREAALRALIAAAPEANRQRLELLQSRVNLERQRSASPLGACVRLNSLMWAGFHRLRRELNTASRELSKEEVAPRSAEVIPFAAARRRQGGSKKPEKER